MDDGGRSSGLSPMMQAASCGAWAAQGPCARTFMANPPQTPDAG